VKQDLGKLLLENEQITSAQLKIAAQEAVQPDKPIGTVLLRLGLVNENVIKTVLELQYAVNYLNLKKIDPDLEVISLLPRELIVQNGLIPISKEDNRLMLAMVNPLDREALAKAKTHLSGLQIHIVVCSDDGFHDFVSRLPPQKKDPNRVSFQTEAAIPIHERSESKVNLIDSNPEDAAEQDPAIVRVCNHILSNAIARGCTNIHLEPAERQILVHYRKEGVLFSARKLPRSLLPDLISRFKSLCSVENDPETLPYDGHISVRHEGRPFFFRLSIVPGAYGEHLIIWLE